MEMPRRTVNQQLVSPPRQCCSAPVGFGQEFLSKEQYENTEATPILTWPVSSWFLPVPSTEISIEGTILSWFNWHHYECDGRAVKVFTKWLPGMFPTPSQSLTEVYSCTMELFRRKCSLDEYAVLYFSEIMWFRKKNFGYHLCVLVCVCVCGGGWHKGF